MAGCVYQISWLMAVLTPLPSGSFYLPGVAPTEYLEGGRVELKVNKMTSVKTQLPYDYYMLPICKPEGGVKQSVENLGEIMTGDMIQNSAYDILMRINSSCNILCRRPFKTGEREVYRSMIDDVYVMNWIIDNLPAAVRFTSEGTELRLVNGFPIGAQRLGHYYVNNHVSIFLQYHSNPEKYDGYRIVGFEVEPRSITQAIRSDPSAKGGEAAVCEGPGIAPGYDLDQHKEIIYTYDVYWTESSVRWASRWDSYLKMSGAQIHWFSILNSVIIILLLSGMVAMILLRTLHRDIAKYNELATAEEAAEETGWKLVHGDVFRKPQWSKLLCVSVGSGVQLLGMSVVTMVFALLGLLSPANRGSLLQSMLILFTFMGVLGGYAAARLYKIWGAEDWKLMTIMTAFLYPGLIFLIFFVLNLFIWGQKSSGSVPFTTMFALLVLWFGISVPLVFIGSYAGFRKDAIELPVRTNPIPRQIKEQSWYSNPYISCMMCGLLPFGAVFTELFFILSSIWLHQFYYVFGFLALVLVLVLVTCAEVSIMTTYFQLTGEDYKWWWRSFASSGASAVYVFLYSMLYFGKLQIDKPVSMILYFGYMYIISVMFFLLTGSVGCLSSFVFVKAIYSSIKVD